MYNMKILHNQQKHVQKHKHPEHGTASDRKLSDGQVMYVDILPKQIQCTPNCRKGL